MLPYLARVPNKRKAGKAVIGAWVDESLAYALKEIATREGLPVSTVIERMVREGATEYGKELREGRRRPRVEGPVDEDRKNGKPYA